jgi:hypothetical protein
MRKDMWDLDVTGMKSSHTFYIGTFDTVAEAEQFFKVVERATSMSLWTSLFTAQSPALLHGATTGLSRA